LNNYLNFENHQVMKNKQHLQDELNEHAPWLNEFRHKDSGHRVPDGYFESLEDSVFRQIEAIGATRRPPAPKKPRPSLWQVLQSLWQPRVALAFAGVLAVVFAAWWFWGKSATEVHYAHITVEDAETYLRDNLMELDPEQLAVVLPAEQMPAIILENGDENTSEESLHLSPEDMEHILRDLSDEELDQLIL